MFFKKNYESLIYLFSYISIIIFYLYSKNSLFSHWSDILDQDVTLVYNSILIGSGISQEYLDHPAFSTFFILNIFHKIGYFLNIVEIKNLDELLNHPNKNGVLQTIHNISQFVHLVYSLILVLFLKKILNSVLRDKFSSFFLSLIFLVSPSFLFLFDIIRSEILSLIFLFLVYFCLMNSFKKNRLFIIFAGVSFVCALLSKVQIILCIFPVLLFFIINDFNFKNYKKINISKPINIIINLLLVIFLVAIIDNYFYKRIDKVFFILVVFFFIFIFTTIEKKFKDHNNSNINLLLFFIGCCLPILGFKFLSKIGLLGFHPALIDIITSPISQMSNISTGYGIGSSDNFEYFHKIKEFFFTVIKNKRIETIPFLSNKFNIFVYFLSFLSIMFFLKKKEYFKTIIILFLISTIVSIILIFNFRPYFFYDIYILPLNLLIISILLQNKKFKRTFSIGIFAIYFTLNFSDLNAQLDQKRLSGIFNYKVNLKSNMKNICKEEQILNKNSYMRFWQKRYSADFLKDLCKSYFKDISQQ